MKTRKHTRTSTKIGTSPKIKDKASPEQAKKEKISELKHETRLKHEIHQARSETKQTFPIPIISSELLGFFGA